MVLTRLPWVLCTALGSLFVVFRPPTTNHRPP